MADETNPEGTPSGAEQQPDLNSSINAAVSSQLKRAMKAVEENFSKSMEAQLAAALKNFTPPPTDSKAKPEKDPALAALQQQLDEATKKAQAAEQRQNLAEQKQKEDKAKSDLVSNLTKAGVRPEMVEIAATYIWAKGLIDFDESGTALFKGKRNLGYGLPEEDMHLPMADGVESYLKKDGAVYMPAPGAGGPLGTARARGPISAVTANSNSIDTRKAPPTDASPAAKSAYAAVLAEQLSGKQ